MQLQILKPNKALNKAYLKEKVSRNNIETFKANLKTLLSKIKEGESEEHHKYPVADFLNDTWYKDAYYINTKDRADFVIHNGKTAKDTAGVILEVKSPTNTAEMISDGKPNKKALQELVLYYLRERIEHNNIEIKHLIVTNINEWYVFDEVWFEKNVFRNTKLKKEYELYKQSGKDTKFFYDSVARPALDAITDPLVCAYFNIKNYERIANNADNTDDNKLIPLYKLLSPTHLLKQPFANDSNSLDTKFYTELLHIIGLEEVKDGGKKLIQRKDKRDPASLLESAIIKLEDKDSLRNITGVSAFGANRDEQLFNVALELCITWVNRILFIKLLEGQLVTYNKGNKDYRFMNPKVIFDYDELNNLFFQVLAERPANRRANVKDKFRNVPYLNSSLFERTALEREAIEIDVLDNRSQLPIHGTTVLKDEHGKRRTGSYTTLHYLLDFLDAYDFSSDGGEEIQEENKNLINASVLGLIFEKINGYKDGSFFTPGFITMYMCRETIRRAVLQKFKEVKGWDCATLDELHDRIDVKEKTEANAVINSLRICDPAVGSGHFLVSALNELIAIKSELKILQDRQHKTLRDYNVEVVNDELVVTDEDGNLLDYNPHNKESQRVQEALFHEKETLIENCLFGVDINPNSVKICRLRLWIELLKNTYYTADSNYTELETLPNIDINIKCGNSLISRFAPDADLGQTLKKSKWNIETYRIAVQNYRNAQNKDEKREMERLIEDIKGNFRTEIGNNDPKVKKLQKLNTEYYQKYQAGTLFDAKLTKEQKKDKAELEKNIAKLDAEIKEIKSNKIFEDAFEWRFEFPEVLDDDGKFVGFDIVIGNPPYIRVQNLEHNIIDYYKINYLSFFQKADVYLLFIEKGISILRDNFALTFINPTLFLSSDYGQGLRELLGKFKVSKIIDFGDLPIFEEAITYTGIFFISRTLPEKIEYKKVVTLKEINATLRDSNFECFNQSNFGKENWVLKNDVHNDLIRKLYTNDGLGTISVVNSGCFTGYDKAYFVDDKIIEECLLEQDLIKPIIMGKEPKKYNLQKPIKRCIYPYKLNENGETELLDEEYFQSFFPNCYGYLLKYKRELEDRMDSRRTFRELGRAWYSYTRKGLIDIFDEKKILVGYIVSKNTYCLDEIGYMFSVGRVFAVKPTDNNMTEALLGILNSRVSYFLMTSMCPIKQGGFYKISSNYLNTFPIPVFDRVIFNKIGDLVRQLMVAGEDDRTKIEEQIDCLVYGIYNLTEEEIRMVEGA